jgi:hypothetical protein
MGCIVEVLLLLLWNSITDDAEMYETNTSLRALQTESVNLRLIEIVAGKRCSMTQLPRVAGLWLWKLFGGRSRLSSIYLTEARVLFLIANCYGYDALETPQLQAVVELVALQGAVTVVRRAVCGTGFADNTLREVLSDVIPQFEALVKCDPSIFFETKHRNYL